MNDALVAGPPSPQVLFDEYVQLAPVPAIVVMSPDGTSPALVPQIEFCTQIERIVAAKSMLT